MSSIEDLLREFRAGIADPDEDAQQRILQRARRAQPQTASDTGGASLTQALSRRWRWVLLPIAVAGALSVLVALAPTQDASDRRGAPTLLQRAEAAIVPQHRIVALSLQTRSINPGAINAHQTINTRQWTLAGAGHAILMRLLISEGPLDRSPTDEDTTLLSDRSGRVIDQRSWTPLFVRARDNYDYPHGGGPGQLEIGGSLKVLRGPLTLAERLRDIYRHQQLRPAGRTANGNLRFRLASKGCPRTEFIIDLDPHTLMPRRTETIQRSAPCRAAARPASREVTTISTARSLPATAANRRLLRIGPWSTARIVQWVAYGRHKPLDHAPPIPPLDQG